VLREVGFDFGFGDRSDFEEAWKQGSWKRHVLLFFVV